MSDTNTDKDSAMFTSSPYEDEKLNLCEWNDNNSEEKNAKVLIHLAYMI